MKHKLSAVIFTFVMAAACMTGCLEDKKNSSAESETTTAAEAVTEAVTDESGEEISESMELMRVKFKDIPEAESGPVIKISDTTAKPGEIAKVTVSVTGLPDDANGKELYFTGDFNGWTEPGKEGSYKVTVADGSISLIASVDAKSSGKFAAAGWTKPEICALDEKDNNKGANISWQDLSFGKTLKGVYSKTLGEAEDVVYICNWSVE